MSVHRSASMSSLLLGVAFVASATVAVAQAPPSGRAVVRLATGDDGRCDAVEKTETVRVSKSKQPFVTFAITNGCPSAVVFSVSGFRHVTRGPGDPIQQAAGQRRVRVAAGATSTTLRLRVRADAPEGEWDYDIRLDDRLVDPKMQIDP